MLRCGRSLFADVASPPPPPKIREPQWQEGTLTPDARPSRLLPVKHKSHIDDLAAWRKEPNHFYYERLYDEYLKREYEVVAIKAYRNRPSPSRLPLARHQDSRD